MSVGTRVKRGAEREAISTGRVPIAPLNPDTFLTTLNRVTQLLLGGKSNWGFTVGVAIKRGPAELKNAKHLPIQ